MAAELLLKQLANANRLMVLCHLASGKKTVGEFAESVGLSQSARSQHLESCAMQAWFLAIAIGLLLIAGSVLGTLFSPAWFLLTGLIGAGLTVAGLTGFCGLALVMAKMPWNQKSG